MKLHIGTGENGISPEIDRIRLILSIFHHADHRRIPRQLHLGQRIRIENPPGQSRNITRSVSHLRIAEQLDILR